MGEVSLGEVEAEELITTDDFEYPLKVAQFLQTIDSDNFTENGIEIAKRVNSNQLLEKETPKDDNSSLFARELNIRDFETSTKNDIFIAELMDSSKLKYRKVVPNTTASKHKEKASNLKNIKNNNPKLYNQITSIDINITREIEGVETNSTIEHKTLKPRLMYSFYKNGYREKILDNNISNLAHIIVESLLYTNNSQKDVKREIIDTLKNSTVEGCLSQISFDEDNKSKEAKKVVDCAYSDTPNSTDIAPSKKLAVAYLDLYLLCDSQDERCLLDIFENNSTIDNQLWYTATKNGTYSEETPTLYTETKSIINNSITKMTKLIDKVSEGLPSDSFLNRTTKEKIERVKIDAKILNLEKWEQSSILWVAIDIDNRAGADINVSFFKPKIIIGDRVIELPNSHLYTALDQSYPASNRAMHVVTPIFIDNQALLEGSNSKLLLEILYKANDDTFQTSSKTTLDLKFNSSDEVNSDVISLSQNMAIVEENRNFSLPTVRLGSKILDKNSIEWTVQPNYINIQTDRDGNKYLSHILKPDNIDETIFFKASNRLDPYSKSATFVLKVIRRVVVVREENRELNIRERTSIPITLEYIREHKFQKLNSEDCKVNSWRVWRNLKLALREDLSTEDNIFKSIQGCLDIQKLVEQEQYEYRRAVVSVTRENRGIFSEFNGF